MTLKPSARGEYEVTDLNNLYIQEQKCKNVTLEWMVDRRRNTRENYRVRK